MAIILIRTLIIFLALIVAMRLMGKRQLGELELSELVVAVLIADIASIPLQNPSLPLSYGLIPLLVLFCCELIFSGLTYKSIHLRKLLYGRPNFIIERGRIAQQAMHRNRFTLDELTQELRNQGILDIASVEYAVLETNGQLNIILAPAQQPVTAEQMHMETEDTGYFSILINNGRILRDNVEEVLGSCDGILVPGGFGNRGIEGKIAAAHYARTHNIPYLGICLGMQIAVIEFARSVCGLADANSGEFDEGSTHKVIDFMPDQSDEINKGGTLRLGAYPCHIVPGTKMAECYGTLDISERHRHRYEFNNDYRALMQEKGLVLSGLSPDGHIVETVEIPENDFYIGVQYHPEFKSRPNKAHPLFKGLISAALRHAERG